MKAQTEKTGETMADKSAINAVARDLENRIQDAERQARSAIFEKVYLIVLENVLSELYSRDDIFLW